MKSNFKVFLKGIIDVSPLMIPVVPFGLIFGVLAIDIGFTPIETMAMSLIIFGGASQIVLLQLFSGGASSLVIISSVGAVNSRHLLYGAVVSEHLSDLKLILTKGKNFLNENGKVYLEHAPDQYEELNKFAVEKGYLNFSNLNDLNGDKRVSIYQC